MNKDWTLNEKELLEAFKNKETSTKEKIEIINLVRYNNGYKDGIVKKKKTISDINAAKNIFLNKMKKDYQYLGEDFITFIIELKKSNIFKTNIEEPAYSNSTNKIVDLTLDTYSKYSKDLYKKAKQIINNKSILFVENIYNSSYMIYLSSLKKAFCVIDKFDSPYNTIHEIQHAIEANANFLGPQLYVELGPITFETLFIDELVKNKYENANLLYFNRINDDYEHLQDLNKYFNALLYAKKYNFNLTTYKFIFMFTQIMKVDKDSILEFINQEITYNYLIDELIYLMSHIKSIEIRDMILNDKKQGLIELRKNLNCYYQNYKYNEKDIDSIKKYVKEINRKK